MLNKDRLAPSRSQPIKSLLAAFSRWRSGNFLLGLTIESRLTRGNLIIQFVDNREECSTILQGLHNPKLLKDLGSMQSLGPCLSKPVLFIPNHSL